MREHDMSPISRNVAIAPACVFSRILHKPLYLALMHVRLFIIIHGDQQQITLVFVHHIEILL